MDYALILKILLAVAAVLVLVIVITFIVGKTKEKKYSHEDGYDQYDDEYDQDEEAYDDEEELEDEDDIDEDDIEDEDDEEEEYIPPVQKKKQWKLILENLDTWERKSIIFYDNIGIGRKRESNEFEKYYVISDDPRTSKLHCAIISNAGKLYLKDMGSRNGTYLNGKKITKPIVLQKEDIIGIGETQIEIKKVLREK